MAERFYYLELEKTYRKDLNATFGKPKKFTILFVAYRNSESSTRYHYNYNNRNNY